MLRVGINGFGRIGRQILRIGFNNPDIEFVGVNDITDAKTLAHLFKWDSIHKHFEGEVKAEGNDIFINGKKLTVFAEKDPSKLPWKDLNVDIVVESTGLFTDKEKAIAHINAGAKKVIISAPAKNEDITIVLGVNENKYDPANHHVISNASCTTNCLAPIVKVLHDNFGIIHGLMTTIHSYTNDQRILDLPHKDLRRARAAAVSIIPTTTGAAKAVGLVIPELKGKLTGISLRVPTINVSVVDFVAELSKDTSVEEVNNTFRAASKTMRKNVLEVCDEPLVSVDFIGYPVSSVVDSALTMVIDNRLVKVISWYDNEWAYSCRVVDLIKYIGETL